MADDTFMPFVIEETTGANRIKVTLDQHETPFGAPRKQEIFTLGGKNERKLIRLNGRPTPIVHTNFTVWKPAVIKGHLRDKFSQLGTAGAIVRDLQQILDNQRLLTLSCGPFKWTAFPEEFDLPVEGTSDFRYELHFDVLSRPGYKPPAPDDERILDFPFDITAEIREILAEDRAKLLAQQIAVTVSLALETAFDTVDQALDDMQTAATAFENAPAKADAEASAMRAKAATVSTACQELVDYLSTATPDDALATGGEDAVAAFQASQMAALVDLWDCQSRMQSLQYTANQRLRTGTKVYQVGPNDTIESIAANELKSDSRVGEIGYKPEDIVPGRIIRIPAA